MGVCQTGINLTIKWMSQFVSQRKCAVDMLLIVLPLRLSTSKNIVIQLGAQMWIVPIDNTLTEMNFDMIVQKSGVIIETAMIMTQTTDLHIDILRNVAKMVNARQEYAKINQTDT